MKHLAMIVAMAAVAGTASALATTAPTAAAWHPGRPAALPAPAIQRLSEGPVFYAAPGG